MAIQLTLIACTIASFFVPSLLSQILTILLFSSFVMKFMPSSHILTRLAYALFLPIGLSPIYLVIRKFFISQSVTRFDLLFMLASIVVALNIYKFFNNRKNKIALNSNIDLKILLSGLSAFLAIGIIQIYLYTKSLGHLFAWFGSGDSRNHLGFGRHVADLGGLNPLTMLQQPIGAPAFLGIILGWKNEVPFSDSEYLISDLMTYGFTWIYFIGLIGLIFSATTFLVWKKIFNDKNVPKILLVFSSLFSLTGIVLGTGLSDGFYTAIYGGLTTGLLIVWVLESNASKSRTSLHYLIGVLLFLGTILAWSYMLLISMPLLLAGLFLSKPFKVNKKFGAIAIVFLALGFLALNFDPIKNLLLTAKSQLLAGGTIVAPSPKFFTSFCLSVIIAGISLWGINRQLGKVFLTIGGIEFFSIYVLKIFSGIDFSAWSYYSLKFQWIALISILGLTVSIALIFVYIPISNIFTRFTKIQKISSTLVAILLIFNFTDTFYGSQNIWQKAFNGWMQPNATVMNTVIKNISTDKNPTILFRYIDPGNQMLGNFWLALYVEPVDPLRGWLYSADTQNDVNWLCDLTKFYPKVRVITADASLVETISGTCASPQIEVQVQTLVN